MVDRENRETNMLKFYMLLAAFVLFSCSITADEEDGIVCGDSLCNPGQHCDTDGPTPQCVDDAEPMQIYYGGRMPLEILTVFKQANHDHRDIYEDF